MTQIRIKVTPKFLQLAQKVMTTEALQELVDALALSPEKGAVIQGTGGIRKIRWRTGKDNKGKSGGVRVLYYYDKNMLVVLLIMVFKKSDKENIDMSEKAQLKKLIPELLRSYGHE
ncbi:MAG: type II toxin-antitoxin system RelE/ParE family toxin [Gammaproteobacteria bacterium]